MQRLLRPLLAPWRSLPLIDRWLLGELVGPLLFGIGAFTAVSLSVGAVFDLVRRIAESGLPVSIALQVLVLELPSFLVLSFPMATLMACLLTYSKLSGNSELTALRSVGVSAWRMVSPALALALVMTLLTFAFNEAVVPHTLRQAEATRDRAIGKAVLGEDRERVSYSRFGNVTQPDGSRNRTLTHFFYAQRMNQGVMEQVTVLDLSQSGQRLMLTAEEGRWNEQEEMWEFRDGRLYVVSEQGGETITSATFDRYLYPLGNQPLKVAKLPTDAELLTIGQARTAERLLRESGDPQAARKLRVRIQEKFSFPAVCLVFGLLGSCLGVRPNARRSRSQGFGLSVLLIFAYYVVAFSFSAMGVNGALTPQLSAWLPVAIFLLIGAGLLRQASR
ncbi:LptF/LptG family permease [Cyanobium sp. CH-040]|nr:LptF/LptG family permease [Cyanobium sp. CH-040]